MTSVGMRLAEEAAYRRWRHARLHGIGGPEAATILDFYAPRDPPRSPGMRPNALYRMLVGETALREEEESEGWSRRLEPLLLDRLHEEVGDVVRSGAGDHRTAEALCVYEDPWRRIWQSRAWPCMLCTPSGYTESSNVLVATVVGVHPWDEVPEGAYAHVQHNLAVLGMERCVISHLATIGLSWQMLWVERNDDFIRDLVGAEVAFWRGVVRRTPPGTRARHTFETHRKDAP